MHKKSFVRGALILALAGIFAKFLGFFFRIPLIYLIGEEGIGLYQITYPLYTFLLSIAFGVPTAISKMISERLAVNKVHEAHRIFKVALVAMVIFGGFSSGMIIIFSNRIIDTFKWNNEVYYSLLGISLAPFFTCILSVYRGYFQGFQYMTPPAISQIIEQLTRVIVGVGLAFILFSKGIDVAAGGASFGATAGAIVGLLFLMYIYTKNRALYNKGQYALPRGNILKEIVKIAIPVSIAHTIGSIMALIDSMLVPGLLRSAGFSYQMATVLYGQLTGKAFVLINVPLTISASLAQSIVPAVSEVNAARDRKSLLNNIKAAYKLSFILALPSCAGLYVLAKPILAFIFQGMVGGWELLQILAIAGVFIIIAQTSTSILNGLGKTIVPILAMSTGCIVKVIISMIFIPIPELNIKAAAYGTLISYAVVAIIDFVVVIKYTRTCINIYEVFILPVVCTAAMTIGVVLIYGNMYNLTGKTSISVLISILIGAITYFIMLILTRTMSIRDIVKTVKSR